MIKEVAYINSAPKFDSEGKLTEGRLDRLKKVLAAYAERAFDLATDPKTPTVDAIAAEYLLLQLEQKHNELGIIAEAEAAKDEVNPWSLLSEKERSYTHKTIAAMAKAFNLLITDFSLLRTVDNEGIETFTIILSSDTGIDRLGMPEIIVHDRRNWIHTRDSEDQLSLIKIDEQTIDTRTGLTDALLFALAKHNPNITNEAVWRTNSHDLRDHEMVPVAILDHGRVYFFLINEETRTNDLRIRPTAVVCVH